ncbi:MAG TPA: TIGR03435 family protein, partial [Acidobacteriaceae bacterium]
DGSTKDDAPAMLKTLLEDRFKLQVHLSNSDQPVFALMVGKGGPKMKDSPELPAIDEDAPLKPGETKLDLAEGPARLVRDPKNPVAGTVNMGTRGSYTQSMDLKSQSLLIDGKGISMSGFIDLLNQVMQIGGSGARQVVDRTGLTGHYEVELKLSIADLIAAARAQGADIPGPPAPPGGGPTEAADPGGGGSTVFQSVQALGLRLEPTKASVQQLVVDNVLKAPTEN